MNITEDRRMLRYWPNSDRSLREFQLKIDHLVFKMTSLIKLTGVKINNSFEGQFFCCVELES